MIKYNSEDFARWINAELEKRGWSSSELGRRGGISQASVSQVISGRQAGPEFCKALSRAFDIPTETIYRHAGLLPAAEELDQMSITELIDIFKNIEPDQREMVLTMAREFYAKRRKK